MITEMPDPNDYKESGLNQLHLAWEITVGLINDYYISGIDSWGDEESLGEYWRKSQPVLGNAYSLVQQSHEFILKGLISEVSPFLLIGRDTRDWPKQCDSTNVSFSAFRTIDAGDLIKVYNTVSNKKLGRDFSDFYSDLRRKRNIIMHRGNSKENLEASDIIQSINTTILFLMKEKSWTAYRWDYVMNDRNASIYSNKRAIDGLIYEFKIVTDFLKPSVSKDLFGFRKKNKCYFCPKCSSEARDNLIKLAQLKSRSKSENVLNCFICNSSFVVERKHCDDCGKLTIYGEIKGENVCLSCMGFGEDFPDDVNNPSF